MRLTSSSPDEFQNQSIGSIVIVQVQVGFTLGGIGRGSRERGRNAFAQNSNFPVYSQITTRLDSLTDGSSAARLDALPGPSNKFRVTTHNAIQTMRSTVKRFEMMACEVRSR